MEKCSTKYSVSVHLPVNCSTGIKQDLLNLGFCLYLLDVAGKAEPIEDANLPWLDISQYTMIYGITTLDDYPGDAIHQLLRRPEVRHRRIEDTFLQMPIQAPIQLVPELPQPSDAPSDKD